MDRHKKFGLIITNPPLITDPWKVTWKAKQDPTWVLGCYPNNLCNTDLVLEYKQVKQHLNLFPHCFLIFNLPPSPSSLRRNYFFTLPDIHTFDMSPTGCQNWIVWSPSRFSFLKSRSISNLAFHLFSVEFIQTTVILYSSQESKEHLAKLKCK